MRGHGWLAAVAAAFVAGTSLFIANTPYRQPGVLFLQRDPATGLPQAIPDIGAPDERQHANYVARIARGEGLPTLVVGDFEGYQAHQPPLYYYVAAAWSQVVRAEHDGPTGVRIRYLNILVGLATLAAVYKGARWAGADRPQAATSASLLLLPMSLALHGAVSNDPLFYCLLTWALAWMVRAAVQGWNWGSASAVGLLSGLAMLTKTPALVALPLAAASWWLAPKEARRPAYLAAALGIALVLVAPWWVRNTQLYGDPLAAGAFERAFVGSPAAKTFIDALGPAGYWLNMVAWWVSRSIVGVFGYMDIFLLERRGSSASAVLYSAALFLLGLPLLGWLRRPGPGGIDRRAALLSLTLCVFVGLFFLRFNSVYFQAQARYLFPALGGVAWLWAAGIRRLVPSPAAAYGLSLTLMLVLGAVSLGAIVDGFPPRMVSVPGTE